MINEDNFFGDVVILTRWCGNFNTSPDNMYLRTETVGHHRGSRNIHCKNFGATFFWSWWWHRNQILVMISQSWLYWWGPWIDMSILWWYSDRSPMFLCMSWWHTSFYEKRSDTPSSQVGTVQKVVYRVPPWAYLFNWLIVGILTLSNEITPHNIWEEQSGSGKVNACIWSVGSNAKNFLASH